jgi:hypothetical protein
MRRFLNQWWRVLTAGLLAAAVLLVPAALLFRPLPDLTAVRQVRPGMTEEHVVQIFGARADATSARAYSLPSDRTGPGTPKYWNCDAGVVEVRFDEQGRVVSASHRSHDFAGPTLLQQLLLRLGF